MKCNLGTNDRFFRVIIGLLIVAAGVLYESYWGFIAIVPLLTSLAGRCPAYLIFGISTCQTKGKDDIGE